MLRMHREDCKTSMCILKLDNQVIKLDQDAKKSSCLLRFEINGTSVAEDLKNFACFPYTECSVLQLRDRESKHVKRLLQEVKEVSREFNHQQQ